MPLQRMIRPRSTRQKTKLNQISHARACSLWPEVAGGLPPRPVRYRSPAHLAFVRTLCCIICRRDPPSDPHHLKFVQLRARGLKTGDQWTIPICRRHHDALELAGNEQKWWVSHAIDPQPLAEELWAISQKNVYRAVPEIKEG